MSKLVDEFINEYYIIGNPMAKINDLWYMAKPLSYPTILERIKDCFRVLRGKSFTLHYKEDEK